MIRRKLISFVLLFISIHRFSQHERFLFIDSFGTGGVSTVGISPASAQKIKENHIKKVERYLYYKKDSVLNKTFLYDSSGNLIKEIMYGRNSIANSVDSMIYDDNNHRIKHYSKSHHQGTLYELFSEYFGDTLVHTTTYMAGNDKVDTTFTVQYFNERKQLQKTISTNVQGKVLSETNYSYTKDGLISKMAYIGSLGPTYGYGYTYEHTFSKNGSKIIMQGFDAKGQKGIITESLYNSNNQCIKCIRYTTFPNRAVFKYNSDNLIFEYTDEDYNPYSKKWIFFKSRFYYYQ